MAGIPHAGSTQHIVEIDYSAGRTILEGEWRAIRLSDLATDWDRNLLYVHDPEEPDGIMVFSLETGDWLRTISTPRGEGPFEFPQGKGRMALAADGRLRELPSELRADGIRHINMHGSKVGMYPLRHVRGPPCPGVLDAIPATPERREPALTTRYGNRPAGL